MAVPERRLAVLVRAWRNVAQGYELGIGHEDLGLAERELVSDAWRMAATMLEESSGLCSACSGAGQEWSVPCDEEEGSWVPCWNCKGSGRSSRVQCAKCARLEHAQFTEVYQGDVWCSGCARADRMLSTRQAENGVPVIGLGDGPSWEPPFGVRG